MSLLLSTALALAVPTQHNDALAPTLLHASTAPTSLHATGPRKLIVMNRGRGGSTRLLPPPMLRSAAEASGLPSITF